MNENRIKYYANGLYILNKEAKRIRDDINDLKSDLFDRGGIVMDTYDEDIVGAQSEGYRSSQYIDDLKAAKIELYNDIFMTSTDDECSRYSDYFCEEMTPEEYDTAYNERIDTIEKEIERTKELEDEAHEKISMNGALRQRQRTIYAIKDKIVREYGTFVETHAFETDTINVYPCYQFGEHTFHIKVDIDNAEQYPEPCKTMKEISGEIEHESSFAASFDELCVLAIQGEDDD